jgi:phosphatidate cytidylyltransferase
LRQRVLTSILLAPAVLLAVAASSPLPVLLLCAATLFVALGEIRRMLRHSLVSFLPTVLFLFGANLLLVPSGLSAQNLVYAAFGLFLAGVASSWFTARSGKSNLLGEGIDGLWAAMPLLLLVAIHRLGDKTMAWDLRNPLLIALLPIWAGDIAAIFIGKSWGRHLLAPEISPKKTWEGSIGNLVACVLVAALLANWVRVSVPVAALCGITAGLAGQAGDLFESYVKRKAGLKDSGTLLPGHGGIMDRIDSILFAAPLVALILYSLG